MNLLTVVVDHTDFVGYKPLTLEHYDRPISERMEDITHDAMAAHAMKQAQAEALTLLHGSMRWTEAQRWINSRADAIFEKWGYPKKRPEHEPL